MARRRVQRYPVGPGNHGGPRERWPYSLVRDLWVSLWCQLWGDFGENLPEGCNQKGPEGDFLPMSGVSGQFAELARALRSRIILFFC
jgi:hypothetical protein